MYEGSKGKCNVIVVSGDYTLRLELMNTKKVYEIFPKPTNLDWLKSSIDRLRDELTQEKFPTKKFYGILLKLNLNPYSHNVKVLNEAIELCYYN